MTNVTDIDSMGDESYYDFKIAVVAITPIILGSVHSLVRSIFHFLIPCLFVIFTTKDGSQGKKMDNIVSKGWCESRELSPSLPPGSGTHFVWIKGPVIVMKNSGGGGGGFGRRGPSSMEGSSSRYTIYCPRFTKSSSEIQELLLGGAKKINILWVESGNSYNFSTTSSESIAPKPFRWQQSLAENVCSVYSKKERVSILLCGAPGLGKTSSCNAIALVLRQTLNVEPIIVRGVSLTQTGFTLGEINSPTSKKPVILIIDEIDSSIKYAEEQKEKCGEFRSIAKDPTSMLSFLDRVNETSGYVLLLTSNLDADEFICDKSIYHRYTRKGRVDTIYNVRGDPCKMEKVSIVERH